MHINSLRNIKLNSEVNMVYVSIKNEQKFYQIQNMSNVLVKKDSQNQRQLNFQLVLSARILDPCQTFPRLMIYVVWATMIPELNDRPRTMFPMYVLVSDGIFVITPFGICFQFNYLFVCAQRRANNVQSADAYGFQKEIQTKKGFLVGNFPFSAFLFRAGHTLGLRY